MTTAPARLDPEPGENWGAVARALLYSLPAARCPVQGILEDCCFGGKVKVPSTPRGGQHHLVTSAAADRSAHELARLSRADDSACSEHIPAEPTTGLRQQLGGLEAPAAGRIEVRDPPGVHMEVSRI